MKVMAGKYRCGVIFFRSINKGGGTRSVYRGGSSIGFIAANQLLESASGTPEEHSNVNEAMNFLSHFLQNGSRPKCYILEAARKQGISRASVGRARLGLVVRKIPSADGTYRGKEQSLAHEM
jgi:hypothetical protein